MSQQIRVLQCIQCKMYQVDLVKKANKWECKICRQKQDLLKEFFRGSGPECRAKVQQMNLERGQQEERIEENLFLSAQQQQLDKEEVSVQQEENQPPKKTKSKWTNYVDKPIEVIKKSAVRPAKLAEDKEEPSEDISMNFNRSNGHVSKPTKRPAQNETSLRNKSSKWSNYL